MELLSDSCQTTKKTDHRDPEERQKQKMNLNENRYASVHSE